MSFAVTTIKSSTMDVYRSSSNCLFKLCVICYLEIRDGSTSANHRYPINGGIMTENCPTSFFSLVVSQTEKQ